MVNWKKVKDLSKDKYKRSLWAGDNSPAHLVKDLFKDKYRLLGIVGLFVVWEILSLIFPPVILPSIEETLSSLAHLIVDLEFWKSLSYTIERVLVGFGLSLILGGGIGILAGLSEKVHKTIKPVITIAQSVPAIIWVIFAIIWFGLGSIPVIFAIMSLAVPIIALNLAQGIRDIDPDLLEMAQSFSVKKQTKFRHLYLPAITGYFFSAASIGLGFTWRVTVMAEFFGSMTGIGNKLNWAMLNLDTEQAFAYALVVISLGLATEYLVVKPLQNYSRKWRQK